MKNVENSFPYLDVIVLKVFWSCVEKAYMSYLFLKNLLPWKKQKLFLK